MARKNKKLANLVWPPFCIGCRKSTENFDSRFHAYLCPQCLEKLARKANSDCVICGNPKGVQYNLCTQCANNLELKGMIRGGSYKNPILKKAIHSFKYKGIKDLSLPLAHLITQNLKNFFRKQKRDQKQKSTLEWALIPVPLTTTKRRKRGFNQAKILARHLAKIFAIPIKTDIMKKDKQTKAQMEIENSQRRKENLQDAFSLNAKKTRNLNARKIILVDDVATTGTTLNECAKTLKPHTKRIWSAVIAT